ncbi:MAG TPA: hypothetical protein VFK41_13580 [Nocardioidaceae bacterium]|nr:hypothetical protein [Nocardioidaceae bacterium]
MTIGQGTIMRLGVFNAASLGISVGTDKRARARSAVGVVVAALVVSVLGALPQAVERLSLPDPGEASLSAEEQASIEAQIQAAQLSFRPAADGSYLVANADAGITARLSADGLAVRSLDARGRVVLETAAFGRPGTLVNVPEAAPAATDTTATVQRGGLVEWFRNRDGGLEQGWTLPTRPRGEGALVLDLGVRGASVEVAGRRSARFVLPGGSALSYDGLAVHDAQGTELDARFVETSAGLRVRVDDAAATYPVVIDPVLSAVATIDPTPNAAMDHYGFDVDIDGRWMVVTAYTDQMVAGANAYHGSVNVYFDDTGNGDWRLLDKLTGHPAFQQVGISVALEVEPAGVTIVAGGPAAARVAIWTYAGDPVTVAPNADPSAPTILTAQPYTGVSVGQYGYDVDLDNGVLVIGAPFASRSGLCTPDGPDANADPDTFGERIGLVEVRRRSGGFGTPFVYESRLEPPGGVFEADPANRDVFQEFGRDVSVADGLVAVGAIGDDGVLTPTAGTCAAPAPAGTNTNDGAVYVFRSQGAGTWTQQAKVLPDTRRTSGAFGSAVALHTDGDLLVGEPGNGGANAPVNSARAGQAFLYDDVYDALNGTDTFTQIRKFNNDDPTTVVDESDDPLGDFGHSVAFDETGTQLAIGAWRHNIPSLNTWSGATLIYERPGTHAADVPDFRAKVPASVAGEGLGWSVALSSGRVVSGAPNANLLGYDTGRAEVWSRGAGGTWSVQEKLEPVGDEFPVDFGYGFARDGDLLAVSTIREGRGISRILSTIYLFRLVNGQWVFDDIFWADAGNILSAPARYDGGLDIWVKRGANGAEQGVYVAVGSTQDSQIDLDGRGDPQQPQDVGAIGTVAVFGRLGGTGAAHTLFSAELWAGGNQEYSPAGRAGAFSPADVTVGGRFGASLAFTDDGTLLVGEPNAAGGAGKVHRYERDGAGEGWNPNWVFAQTTVGEAAAESGLGTEVVAEGQTVFTASRAANGFIRLHQLADSSATGALTSTRDFQVGLPASPLFSIDTDGTRLAVGAIGNDSARVYKLPTATTPLTLEGEFTAPSNGNFGISVALGRGGAHKSLIVGRPFVTGTTGQAEVYVARTSTGGQITTWSNVATLAPPAGDPSNGAFGFNVLNYPDAGGALVSSHTYAVPVEGRGRVYRFSTEALVPAPGPEAIVDVSTPSAVPVGASYIPTAGLAPSLLTQGQSSGTIASTSLGGIDLSQPPAGTTVEASPLSSIPLSSIPLSSIPLSSIPLSSIPLSSIAGGWETVLEGTAYDGVPLQSVTLQQVLGLPQVQSITLADVDLSATPLSSIPLSSIALAGVPLSSIPLPGEAAGLQGWCDSLTELGYEPADLGLDCSNLANPANEQVTLLALAVQGVPLSSIPLSSIPLSSIDLTGTPLSSIPLSSIDIAGSPLSSIPLSSIPLSSIPLSSIPLSSIPLSSIPLSSIPLSSIELGGTPLSSIPLSSIDIAGTPLSSIPLSSIPLSSIPLSSIPLSSIPLSSIPLSSIPLSSIPLSSIPLSSIDIAGSPLSSIPLSSIPVSTRSQAFDCSKAACDDPDVTVGESLAYLQSGATLGMLDGALTGVRLGDLATITDGWDAAALRAAISGVPALQNVGDLTLGELPQLYPSLDLGEIQSALAGIRLGDIAALIDGFTAADVTAALGQLTLANLQGFDDLALGELAALQALLTFEHLFTALDSVRLDDLVGIISDGSGGTYDAGELRAALADAVGANADLGDLGPDFGDLTLGELAAYGDTTLGELLAVLDEAVTDGITLGDLLLALIARTQYPWEALDLDNALSQTLDGSDQSVPVSVAFEAQAPDGQARDVTLSVRVPEGSVYLPGSASLSIPVAAGELKPERVDGTLVWSFSGVPAGAVHTLTFGLEPTVQIGTAEVSATLALPADDVWSTDDTGLSVIEVLEPNDTPAEASSLPSDTIVLSHVSSTDDIDVFSFQVTRAGTRVSLSLSNLDADLDLVLYAPKASSTTIQETSDRSIVPVEDESAATTATEVAPTADEDVAHPAGLGDLAVFQTSLRRGTADEQVDTGPLARTGTYYAAVHGYNGATNRSPYALRMKKFESTAQPPCTPRSVNTGTVTGSLPAQLPAGTNTVFLVNQSRMAGLFTPAQAASVRAGVDQLVAWTNDPARASLGVKAAVLAVDADPGVRSAYAAWDAEPCRPETANGVAAQIVRVLDTYRDAGARLKHIVVVGGDDAIPFARVPDKTEIANERTYASTFSDARNALSATFSSGHVLTDDAYGDLDPYGFGDRVLFVTDAAVGRLVETPAEITDQLTDYTTSNGRLNVGTGLVTGYDFLTDGSNVVGDKLDETYGTVDRSLISETWTRGDLEAAIDAIKPDVASINAHFDHFRALPGLGNSTQDESDLFTAAAVRGALSDDLAGSIVFSMGCHGGLSASDLLVAAGRSLDFAQAVSSQGGVFVGNTGYGYGDTELVALSERLMAAFADRLDGALSVGEALQYAKAEYAADLTAYGVYDEKALMEATFYGLPFYRLNVPNPPPAPPAPPTPVLSPDPVAGVDTSTIEVTPTVSEKTSDDGATYFVGVDDAGEEQTTALHDRPVQPRTDETFSAPAGKEAHDALVLDLLTTDLHGVLPHIVQPVVDDGDERVDEPVDVAFPSSPVRVNPQLVPSGEAFTLSATTGYFRTTAVDGSGIQRLVDSMTVTPYFVGESVDDFVRPTIRLVEAVVDASSLTFSVDVVDDRGTFDRIKRVYVLAIADPEHGVAEQWQSVDLVRTPGDSRWTGSLPISGDEIEYVVQAVDAAGNVAVAANKSLFFRDEALSQDPPSAGLRLQVNGPQGNAGWYVGPVTVTAKGGSDLTYEVVGSVSERPYEGPFTIGADGPHTVIVRSSDGQEVARTIKIDTTGPVVFISSPANNSTIAHRGGTTAQFSCLDAGSGVTSCAATLTTRNGFGNSAGTTAPVENGADVSGTIGRHTLIASTGADVAGNPAQVATATSNFNVVPPPRINAVNLPNNPGGGSTRSVATSYSGAPQAAPYTTTYTWDDGTSTTCRSDQVVSGCSILMGADGVGSTLATHTYNSLVERDVFVRITDAIGQTTTGTISFNKTTVLTAKAAGLTLSLGGVTIAAGALSAKLTDKAGVALPGRTITFKASTGTALCTATTGTDGVASCPKLTLSLSLLAAGSYTASVPSDSQYLGVTTTAALFSLG